MAIKKNQMVTMNYELKVNEEIIDGNIDDESIQFIYGTGELIPGLESRISDMNEGETKEIKVPATEAYGEYEEKLTETLPIANFDGLDLEIGMVLEADGEEKEEVIKVTVIEVTEDTVTVDYNHPLAGSDLDFTIIIQKIV